MENRVYYGEYSLKHWIDLILKGNISLPDYQRYFVWSEKKVETLIDTFKKKQFVPPVTIGAFKKGNTNQNLILDGQQRLTSLLLAFLGLYPDQATYKKTIEIFASENDDEDDDENELLDNILEWTFELLIQKGSNRASILEKITEGNYKKIDLNIDNDFLESTFLGFSYLVPYVSDENEQQKYYSSVFRNINIQGEILLPQESRASLYFLDKDLVQFFEPEFSKTILVKGISSETKADFVRYLSLLSQYNKDESANNVARSYKPQMEKYYEEYIYSVIADVDSKYGKFSASFPNKKYDDRFLVLKASLSSLEVPKKFSSIIELDMYLFGLIYHVIFQNKEIDDTQKVNLKQELEDQIAEFKADASHTKAPSNLGHLRSRIRTSIEIYENYAS
jgi:bifunctional DNA-binding transcriptional regulator/antitoxin component of YhaV-PrlF toxin-antitoxin module